MLMMCGNGAKTMQIRAPVRLVWSAPNRKGVRIRGIRDETVSIVDANRTIIVYGFPATDCAGRATKISRPTGGSRFTGIRVRSRRQMNLSRANICRAMTGRSRQSGAAATSRRREHLSSLTSHATPSYAIGAQSLYGDYCVTWTLSFPRKTACDRGLNI